MELTSALFLKPIISAMVGNLIPWLMSQRIFGDNIVAEINQWKTILDNLCGVLQDAENRKTNDEAIRKWVQDLEDVICDIEDVVEFLNYQVLKQQVEGSPSTLKKICQFPYELLKKRKLYGESNKITNKLQSLKERKDVYKLLWEPIKASMGLGFNRSQTSSLPGNDQVVFGRDEDKRKIGDLLIQPLDKKFGVLPIIGMGGLGKTTLARLVYNDDELTRCFDIKVWVCVSAHFEIRRITEEILESISPDCRVESQGLNWIQNKLSQRLSQKRFLIILDDLWNENYLEGHVQVMDVLRMSYSFLSPQLKRCFAWFATLPEDYPFSELEIVLIWIGVGVVSSTEGDKSKDEVARDCFEQLLSRSLFSQTPNTSLRGKTLYAMHDLVRDLAKEVFGRDSIIGRSDKLLKSVKGTRHILCDYSRFKEVVDVLLKEEEAVLPLRTFSEWSNGGGFYKYEEHIKQSIIEDVLRKGKYIRAFSLVYVKELPDRSIGQLTLLRYLRISYCFFQRLPNSVTLLYNLEVLNLMNCYTLLELPEKIGNLIKLSHLVICFCTKLKQLPPSIGKLQKLCHLEVSWCGNFREVPAEIGQLQNLRYLCVSGNSKLERLPDRIGELQNLYHLDVSDCDFLKVPILRNLKLLTTVPKLVVTNNDSLPSLYHLKILHGSLKICGLEKVTSPEDATVARLSEKKLSKLHLEWDLERDIMDIEGESEILDLLQPHEKLQRLSIRGYGGSKFPNWLIGSLRHLRELVIWDCNNCTAPVTNLSMPSLTNLMVGHCPVLVLKLPEILPDLLSLRKLNISELPSNVLKLMLAVRLPNLKELQLRNCQDIVTFPSEDTEIDSVHLTSSLSRLSIGKFPNLKRISSSQVLSSVSRLEFQECEALAFPDEGLPRSLKELWIRNCPLLETRFPKKKDKDLPFEVFRISSDR